MHRGKIDYHIIRNYSFSQPEGQRRERDRERERERERERKKREHAFTRKKWNSTLAAIHSRLHGKLVQEMDLDQKDGHRQIRYAIQKERGESERERRLKFV